MLALISSALISLLLFAIPVTPDTWHAGPWSNIQITTYHDAHCTGKSHDYGLHYDDTNYNHDADPLFLSYRLNSLAYSAKDNSWGLNGNESLIFGKGDGATGNFTINHGDGGSQGLHCQTWTDNGAKEWFILTTKERYPGWTGYKYGSD